MTDDIGKTFAAWWHKMLRPDQDNSAARALRARLRRADHALDVLAQPQVHDLVAQAPWLQSRPDALVRVVQVVAYVERNDPRNLGRVLGAGDSPAMSPARFERLVRTTPDDLARAIRRSLTLCDGACHVANLARDVLNWDSNWGDDIRRNWYFDYFNAARPAATETTKEVSQ